jgi:hypothetical protein
MYDGSRFRCTGCAFGSLCAWGCESTLVRQGRPGCQSEAGAACQREDRVLSQTAARCVSDDACFLRFQRRRTCGAVVVRVGPVAEGADVDTATCSRRACAAGAVGPRRRAGPLPSSGRRPLTACRAPPETAGHRHFGSCRDLTCEPIAVQRDAGDMFGACGSQSEARRLGTLPSGAVDTGASDWPVSSAVNRPNASSQCRWDGMSSTSADAPTSPAYSALPGSAPRRMGPR